MMIEGVDLGSLANFGVLGLWTIFLLVEKFTSQKSLKESIDNNTKVMTSVSELMRNCQKK